MNAGHMGYTTDEEYAAWLRRTNRVRREAADAIGLLRKAIRRFKDAELSAHDIHDAALEQYFSVKLQQLIKEYEAISRHLDHDLEIKHRRITS